MRIFCIRHADPAFNSDRYPNHDTVGLSELGRQQAQDAADFLKWVGFRRIVSSPLGRATETARIISHRADLPFETDIRFSERVFEPLFGLSYDTIADRFGVDVRTAITAGNSDGVSLSGCSSLMECERQAWSGVVDLVANGANPTLLVFHGGPHEWILKRMLGITEPYTRRRFALYNCHVSILRFPAQVLDHGCIQCLNVPLTPSARNLWCT